MPLNLTPRDLLYLCGFHVVPDTIRPPIEYMPAGGVCPICWAAGEVLTAGNAVMLAYCRPCRVQWFPSDDARKANIRFRNFRMVEGFLPSVVDVWAAANDAVSRISETTKHACLVIGAIEYFRQTEIPINEIRTERVRKMSLFQDLRRDHQ